MRTALFALTAALVGVIGFAQEPNAGLKGARVMPKLDAVVKINQEVIDSSTIPIPWIVQDVRGDWLWIGHERKGWVQRSQVVTLDEAPAYYTGLIQENKHKAWAYAERAVAWAEKDEPDLALADYGEVLRLNPTAVTYNNRGEAWRERNDIEKAISDFSQAIRLDPNYAIAYVNRGLAYTDKGDFDKAIADFNRAIELNPSQAMAYTNRGRAWQLGHKDYEKAFADYEQALRLDPNCATACTEEAWTLATCPIERLRNGKRAVELARKALALHGGKDYVDLDTLAAAYAEAGDFDAAIKYENQAIEDNPRDADFVKWAKVRLNMYGNHAPFREK